MVQGSIRDTQVVAYWLVPDESCDRERPGGEGRSFGGLPHRGAGTGAVAIFGWKDVTETGW